MNREARITALAVVMALLAILAGCTRNNGDIGPLFGIWHLEEMRVDGVTDNSYTGNSFWSFQNDIICISTENDPLAHAPERTWGTWSRVDGLITLDFSHTADGVQPPSYIPPAYLMFGNADKVPLAVETEKSGNMVLKYQSPTGSEVIYYFKKF